MPERKRRDLDKIQYDEEKKVCVRFGQKSPNAGSAPIYQNRYVGFFQVHHDDHQNLASLCFFQ